MTVRFSITSEIGGDLVGMPWDELRLCKVNGNETVVFFTDTRDQSKLRRGVFGGGQGACREHFRGKGSFSP